MHDISRMRTAVLLGVAPLLLAGCRDGRSVVDPEPVAGRALFAIVSPHGAEGAAVLELQGGGWSEPRADADAELYVHRDGESARLVLVRAQPGELRFHLHLDDLGRPPAVRVLEVADGDDRPREALAGYHAVFAREAAP
jgi:hypothetical protein